ncbi:hypothetical protein NO1_0770 [Candidatus Termititenax aidoneus]|uniref:Uncharacterized protein n=1 Tax=Termititenax aidoneus TaxID=2218524 RepID=A0A388TB25_TERA1|nr:hypothetical protein NO1_0770 [Candidatus Termititenax aidoneus]
MQTKIVGGYYWEGWKERRQEGAKESAKIGGCSYEELLRAVKGDYSGEIFRGVDDSKLPDGQYRTLCYAAAGVNSKALKYINKTRFSAEGYFHFAKFACEKHWDALKYVNPNKLPMGKMHLMNYYEWIVLPTVYRYHSAIEFVNWNYVSLPDDVIYAAARGRINRWLFNPYGG